jgi:hypothetical protein
MPNPSTSPGQNQTLLELIYALRGLAQTVELYHSDLAKKIEEEAEQRARELERLKDLMGRNGQAVSVLPITISDRVEKLITRVEDSIDKKFDGVQEVISDVKTKLALFEKSSERVERAITDNEGTVEERHHEEFTGRIELSGDEVKVTISSEMFARIWAWGKWALLALAAGGGVHGLLELIKGLSN